MTPKQIEVLLVEDDLGDAELTQEMLTEAKVSVNLRVVQDGVEALAYLRREGSYAEAARPDLVLLDLNMPRKDGREVLRDIRAEETLRSLPIVVLTTSESDEDILKSYDLGANCYVTKPVGLDQFARIIQCIEEFWFTVVKLPPK
ncbi:MAG: response regulator [Armatimonadetes bacterium CG_4_10_14_3_um_filter_66_18]|nr:response regulator [Armatimonadota bacterium]OIP10765.1 MAG: response regulator [Armatimonadetes bacterium CG2_30_66_41]PIU94835.1 MAG: response regulator [Armatimonadetes bacterium CG06_land_8_20_14_3_00_66_21]PIX36781.1 MAG: response regulator [Armatimonadetes bacterium CG_4_8_14_3_um_filter_66_20]PIY39130.1 MAG: response regulator [Armatimonadetes bacterium CG_4_10_14_3_um_filter_66_18]PIZ45038.1 MAG: response regulator [Armatimonadetes bacterium CG_4_10_14_0_8_um_filter_66_14]